MLEDIVIEQKKIFLGYVKSLLVPVIFKSFSDIYQDSIKINDDNGTNRDCLVIFQGYIKKIKEWSRTLISNEYIRIKNSTNTGDYFDNLIKATFVSYIKVLQFGVLDPKYKEFTDKINTEDFIHRCYINTARHLYGAPYLMYHRYKAINIKENQVKAREFIADAIEESFVSMLPLNMLLSTSGSDAEIVKAENPLQKISSDLAEIKILLETRQFVQPSAIPPTVVLTGGDTSKIVEPMDKLNVNLDTKQIEIPQILNQPVIPNAELQITTDAKTKRDILMKTQNVSMNANEISTNMFDLDRLTKEHTNNGSKLNIPLENDIKNKKDSLDDLEFANTSEEKRDTQKETHTQQNTATKETVSKETVTKETQKEDTKTINLPAPESIPSAMTNPPTNNYIEVYDNTKTKKTPVQIPPESRQTVIRKI